MKNKITQIIYLIFAPILFFILESIFFKKKASIIVSTQASKVFAGNTKHFFLYLDKNYSGEYYVVTKNRSLYNQLSNSYKNKVLYAYSLKGLKTYLQSKYVMISHGKSDIHPYYPISIYKTFINVWHGTPLKKVCLLNDKKSKNYKSNLKFCKYVCTSSEFTKFMMAKQFGSHVSNMWITGQPRNDCFFNEINESKDDSLLSKKYILYTPTYRENSTVNYFPFKDFDSESLDKFLTNKDYYIYIRCHINEWKYLNKQFLSKDIDSKRIVFIDYNTYPDVQIILKHASILLTDYSSIYYDFLILDRPIIFIPYDYEEYKLKSGFNVDYYDNTPGDKVYSFKSFLESLNKNIDNPDIDSEKRIIIRDKYNKYIQGDASSKILENMKLKTK